MLVGVVFIAGIIVVCVTPDYRNFVVKAIVCAKNNSVVERVPRGDDGSDIDLLRIRIKQIFPIGEYASLRILARCPVRLSDDLSILNWKIPFTGRSLKYDLPVTLKLGIDCEKIEIDATRKDSVFITFPPMEVLSTEQHLKDAEIIEWKDGILNKITLKEQHYLITKQIEHFQDSIMGRVDIINDAKRSTEIGFKSIFAMHPDIPPPSFRWMESNKSAITIETKGEI